MKMYYGTGNDSLGTANDPFDPEFPSKSVFEFGHGFYLANKMSTAEAYAKIAFIDKQASINSQQYKKGCKVLENISNSKIKSYIHVFNVDLNLMRQKYTYKEIKSYKDMQSNLRQVVINYRTNPYYRPSVIWTYGYLAGPEFDKLFSTSKSGDIDIEKAIEQSIINRINDNQLCIHKRLIGNKTNGMKYLNDLDYLMKISLDKRYFEKKSGKAVALVDSFRKVGRTIIMGLRRKIKN